MGAAQVDDILWVIEILVEGLGKIGGRMVPKGTDPRRANAWRAAITT